MALPKHIFVEISDTVETLIGTLAYELIDWAKQCIEARGQFSLALSGGNTPTRLYERLALLAADTVEWDKFKIFFGDERCVGPEHPNSNYRMIYEAWLKDETIPKESIHRMIGESLNLDNEARRYESLIRRELSTDLDQDAIPMFDAILLGMGDDGHTASLFPGTQALNEMHRLVVVNEVPQLNTRRLTFTFPLICASRRRWVLVTGTNKSERIAQALDYDTPSQLPITQATTVQTDLVDHQMVFWRLDRAAAIQIPLSAFMPNRSSL